MLVGAAEGVRSEVIAWFAFDKAPLRAQYSAYRARARIEAGAGGLPSSFFALWASCVCVCVYYCSTYYKAVREGGGEVEDMCYEGLRAEAYVN